MQRRLVYTCRFKTFAASRFHNLIRTIHAAPSMTMTKKTGNEKAAVLQYLAMFASDLLYKSLAGKVSSICLSTWATSG
jgi:hypothetical protein